VTSLPVCTPAFRPYKLSNQQYQSTKRYQAPAIHSKWFKENPNEPREIVEARKIVACREGDTTSRIMPRRTLRNNRDYS